MRNRTVAAMLLAVAAIAAGCGRTQQTTFYTLKTVSSGQTAPDSAGPKVSIAAVSIPDFLDRPQLVLADEGAKVSIMETHRWAEPLKNSIPRILAGNLAARLGDDRVSYAPQYASIKSDYRVFVDIRRLEASSGEATVEALITVKSSKDNFAPVTRRSIQTAKVSGTGYGAMVEAYSAALERLAGDIAAALPKK